MEILRKIERMKQNLKTLNKTLRFRMKFPENGQF